MRKLFLLFILISGCAFGQITLSKENGLTKYIVTEVPGKSASEIYQKTIDWINKTYQRADVVIQGEVKDDYIRFQGIDGKSLCQNPQNKLIFSCLPFRHHIEISVKDGKYKFEIVKLEQKNSLFPKYSSNPWMDLIYTWNKKGELKPAVVGGLPDALNALNNDLKSYILGESKKSNDDW